MYFIERVLTRIHLRLIKVNVFSSLKEPTTTTTTTTTPAPEEITTTTTTTTASTPTEEEIEVSSEKLPQDQTTTEEPVTTTTTTTTTTTAPSVPSLGVFYDAPAPPKQDEYEGVVPAEVNIGLRTGLLR